jgi:hypothetical protein
MTLAIAKTGTKYFRIHDTGDYYSQSYFDAWCSIARALPRVKFWAPTRQVNFVRAHGTLPGNLRIRASAAMIDQGAPRGLGMLTSTVHRDASPIGFACRKTDGACGPCRACWDGRIRNVSYRAH